MNSTYIRISTSKDTIVWSEELENGERGVFKLYLHRGPISWMRERSFRFRVQREYQALAFLEQNGIPCTKPLYWSYGKCPGFGRCEMLVSQEIKKSTNFKDYSLALKHEKSLPELNNLYLLIRKMHAAGFYHGALWPRNILVTDKGENEKDFFIADTPASMIFSKDIFGTRMAWNDLLVISTALRNKFGAEFCAPFIEKYGLSPKHIQKFIFALNKYYPSKHTRNRMRAEFSSRELVSHVFKGRVDREKSLLKNGLSVDKPSSDLTT